MELFWEGLSVDRSRPRRFRTSMSRLFFQFSMFLFFPFPSTPFRCLFSFLFFFSTFPPLLPLFLPPHSTPRRLVIVILPSPYTRTPFPISHLQFFSF